MQVHCDRHQQHPRNSEARRLSGREIPPWKRLHSAEDWDELLLPEIERQQRQGEERCARNRLKNAQFRVSDLPKGAERPLLGAEGSGLE